MEQNNPPGHFFAILNAFAALMNNSAASSTLLEPLKETLCHIMRKPTFCICENKGADQLGGYREADQRLCFRYKDSTNLLLSKSKIFSL